MRKVIVILLITACMHVAPAAQAADLFGIVSDKDARPIETTVTLKDAKGNAAAPPVTTDKKGAYAFKGIKPGSYQVVIGDKGEGKIFVGPGETRRDFQLK